MTYEDAPLGPLAGAIFGWLWGKEGLLVENGLHPV